MDKTLKLNNRIKEFRQKIGLSQEELAKKTSTTRQTIIAVENGTFNPSAKLALLICLVLDKKFEELFYF